ncbi:MAG: class I SAM-dependent methyltransferase [Sandarakinorhabdus sp.]|jgi:ubiquinone/menaquinone biosynthesis C-methylase UbiE|nr:class I SAM-dependent methyltransferase [Sandarakinorhabdus sp.]
MSDAAFTPALGRASLDDYDRAIRIWTRESVWRGALLRQVAPRSGETILDVGCGTGSFTVMLKQAAPDARVVGLDPDARVLELAAAKAAAAGVEVEWRQGFARDAASHGPEFDKAISSLVFHQMPLTEKRLGISAMLAAVRPGGEVHIADYARQVGGLMRTLFRLTVQRLDGVADTQPNADGVLEVILAETDAAAALPTRVVRTVTGAISLFLVRRER